MPDDKFPDTLTSHDRHALYFANTRPKSVLDAMLAAARAHEARTQELEPAKAEAAATFADTKQRHDIVEGDVVDFTTGVIRRAPRPAAPIVAEETVATPTIAPEALDAALQGAPAAVDPTTRSAN